jgi:hypothetical protein
MHIFLRIFGALILAGGLTVGAEKYLHSRPQVQVNQIPVNSAPELDLTTFDSAMVILAGGLCVLHERRRKRD